MLPLKIILEGHVAVKHALENAVGIIKIILNKVREIIPPHPLYVFWMDGGSSLRL